MPSLRLIAVAAASIALQATTVHGAAYGLAVLTNQAQFGDGTGAGPIITDSTMAECFTDTGGECGNCGISFPPDDAYNASKDITDPGVFENDKCGNPCVTYDSQGRSQDDLSGMAVGDGAGTITIAADGSTQNCKIADETVCGGIGLAGANYVNMIVECDPSY